MLPGLVCIAFKESEQISPASPATNEAMIRRGPSVLVLGPGDIEDYELRKKWRKRLETERQNKPPKGHSSLQAPSTNQILARGEPPSAAGGRGVAGSSTRGSTGSAPQADTEHSTPSDPTEDQNEHLMTGYTSSPENASVGTLPASLPKNDFQNVGFVEGGNYMSQPSSPFSTFPMLYVENYTNPLVVPEDNSTSPHPLLPGGPGVRSRTLPRSPLFRFQNASTSPERRPASVISSLTSHPIGAHSTLEEFSRLPPRRPNRTFRHQTNSFSFDDSVRASAAYEQDRISSTSTTDSAPCPAEHINLREELRGTSLGSEVVDPRVASFSTGVSEEGQGVVQEPEFRKSSIFPSAYLLLPPPFSTVSRNTSVAGSLPSLSDQEISNETVIEAREISTSPSNRHTESVHSPSIVNHAAAESADETALSREVSSSSGGPSPRSILKSAVRLISSCRSRSPATRIESPSSSSSPTPRQNRTNGSPRKQSAQTPSRSYQVYNDQLSPATQPQTPAHLPESRHRSRFHPSYTAPVMRSRARFQSINSGDGAGHDVPSPRDRPGGATPSRRGAAVRSRSPMGLLRQGFQGLYGGRENGDEEQNWVEGVRFSNAEVRLWGLRDARGDGRSLRETPEREVWRIGRD